MSARRAGRILLVAGGLLVVLGSFLPEVHVALADLLEGGPRRPPPERSSWGVIRESLDMLEDPDPSLDDWYYVFYAAEVAGLGWLAASGAVVVLAATVGRSRLAALPFGLWHVLSFGGLAVLGGVVACSAPGGDADTEGLVAKIAVASVALALLAVAEGAIAWRALARPRTGGMAPVDRLNALPLAVLLLVDAGLFAALAGHPNWPSAGYAVAAAGAGLALAGSVLRRPAGPQPR